MGFNDEYLYKRIIDSVIDIDTTKLSNEVDTNPVVKDPG